MTSHTVHDADAQQTHESKLQWLARFVRTTPHLTLLVLLYMVQGVPLGFVMGTLPFLLKKHLTYTQIGIFTMASYPYSLKLLWSPLVDSFFSHRVGRRKSWIIPMQTLTAFLVLWLGRSIDGLVDSGVDLPTIYSFTICFFMVIFAAATQDVAVDALAVTLLPVAKRAYASTGRARVVVTDL
jgi:PAT family acetyl-CoA transporter-like MFS transporter 1